MGQPGETTFFTNRHDTSDMLFIVMEICCCQHEEDEDMYVVLKVLRHDRTRISLVVLTTNISGICHW